MLRHVLLHQALLATSVSEATDRHPASGKLLNG